MEVNIKPDENGSKMYKITWPHSPLEFLLVDRDSKIDYKKEAVYILMDKFRRRFYIGETGATKRGGVVNRFRVHKWDKDFWDCALVIKDPHNGFGRDDDRRWFEWKLYEIAKLFAKDDDTVEILSRAGEQEKPYGADETLNVILSVCRLIGICWAFGNKAKQESATTAEKVSKSKKRVITKPSLKPSTRKQFGKLNQTQFAKLIAQRAGKPGSYGHVWLMLAGKGCKNGRRCRKDSEWRKPLEDAGVKFDKDDYVINWQDARIPL